MFFPYIILFLVVFVSGGLFGNDTWSARAAAIITTIAVVSTLLIFVFTATTVHLAVVAVLILTVITPIAMFTGVATGVLTKHPLK